MNLSQSRKCTIQRDMTISLNEPCPKRHLVTTTFERAELLSQLDSGSLELFCSMCGEPFKPSVDRQLIIYRRIREAPVHTAEGAGDGGL